MSTLYTKLWIYLHVAVKCYKFKVNDLDMGEGQKQLIELINAKLKTQGHTIRDAASIMGMSHATLGHILTGRNAITAESAIRIAVYLDLPYAQILHLADQDEFLNLITPVFYTNIKTSSKSDTPQNPYIQQISHELNGLTTSQLNLISDLARTFKESNAPAPISDTVTPITYPTKRGKKQ